MRYFISAGEPSGDLHGSTLVKRLRQRDPSSVCVGFGGRKMTDAGCTLLHPLAENPIVGLGAAFRAVPKLLGVLREAVASWRVDRPDVVVLIDNPGFNWHVAKAAKKQGIPVVYFIPPQIWAWANWRVSRMRRWVDAVLCSLPFEPAWYHQRGVPGAEYIGHPFFDALHAQPVDEAFLAAQRADGRRVVALFPGSRSYEIQKNTGTLLRAAELISERRPGVRFVAAPFREDHAAKFRAAAAGCKAPVDVFVGRTAEIQRLAHVAVSVSGSISLELMYHAVPTAIVYRIPWSFQYVLRPLLVDTPYVTLVNLMADAPVYPEFVGSKDESIGVAEKIGEWLADDGAVAAARERLLELKSRYGAAGATAAAAERIVALASSHGRRRAAA